MNSSSIPHNPTSNNVAQLLPKFNDADADLRYMSLNDLYSILKAAPPSLFNNDYNTCARTVDGLLKTLDDPNGDVQSQAIKCLGPLAAKAPNEILAPLIEKLSNLKATNSLDTSIPATALRTLIVSFPRPLPGPGIPQSKGSIEAYSAISKVLIPRLVGYIVIPHGLKNRPAPPRGMLEIDPNKGVDSDSVDVLIELVRCFGPMLHDMEKSALQNKILEILENDRTGNVAKKKTIAAISILAVYMSDSLLSMFISKAIDGYQSAHLQRRLLLTILGSLARSIPQRLGPYLRTLVPFVFAALSKEEYDETLDEIEEIDPIAEEVKEAALLTLEGFLSSCSNEMRPYTEEAIDSSLRYVNYDPTLAAEEEDDEAMGGSQGGDDDDDEDELGIDDTSDAESEAFEEEGGMSDDDDASWKIRRCAAKALYAIIMTRGNGDLLDNGTLYERVAPTLIKCFKEREENVRLEILATLAALIKKTGEGLSSTAISTDDEGYASASSTSKSRKRRRGSSDAMMFDAQEHLMSSKDMASPTQSPSPLSNASSDLARLGPSIIQGATKLLKSSSVPTRQAVATLLRDLVYVQPRGLSEHLGQIVDPTMDFVKTSGTLAAGSSSTATAGAVSATNSSLRIEALHLVGAIFETQSSTTIAPYLRKIVPGLILAIKDQYFKVSSEAICVAENTVRVLTPPKSAGMENQFVSYINNIFDAVFERASTGSADLEVRQRALHALGVIIAQTSGSRDLELLPIAKRSKALDTLHDRLRNETTRLESIQAIDTIAPSLKEKDVLKPRWVQDISIELAGQLRKSDRILRDTSLKALKRLVANSAVTVKLDDNTVRSLVQMLLPLLDASGLSFLGPVLGILADLVQRDPKTVVNSDLDNALCKTVLAPLGGSVLEAFLGLIKVIGVKGAGHALMQGLLKNVGVTGDPAIVGAAIGTLLVSGGSTVGIQIEDFVKELQTAPDDRRKCLALSVLGEAGLRLGSSSPLQPTIFSDHFKSRSAQVPRAAAVALGRAGAGDVTKYMPVILSAMSKPGSTQYLLLHSIKEILQYAGQERIDLSQYTSKIWEKLFSASDVEDNKAVGAECIGRLLSIEPRKYFPLLQSYLQDPAPSVRGMVIQAIRFAFTDTDEDFDRVLKPILVGMLKTMLNDTILDNRRLALTTLNSATHNKPAIIFPHLSQLLPLVIKESVINPALVREVQMGPFKHKVDDGIEVRKSAYETLNALMDSAFSRLNPPDLYDRVTAGLTDEHDIKVLCILMINKLITLSPDETSRRLDALAERFQPIMAHKPKENAVKQELEKTLEVSKGVLRLSVRMQLAFPDATGGSSSGGNAVGMGMGMGAGPSSQVWAGYWEWLKKEMRDGVQAVEAETKL